MLGLAVGITLATVIFIKFLEQQESKLIRTILDWFPAILFAYVIPALITYLGGLDMSDIALHDWSRDLIMPLAILTVMSALSFKQLKIIGIRPILLFATGSMVIATIPVLLVWLAKYFRPEIYDLVVEQEYWKGLVPIVGSWIGGSTSQLVLKEVVECPDQLFITMLVMDNVLVNLWTILMFQFIKKSDTWNGWFRINDQVPDFVPDHVSTAPDQKSSLIITSFICIVVLMLSYFLIQLFLVKILILSLAGLLLGNFIKEWNHALVLKIGGLLIVTIMAILGLKLNFGSFLLPVPIIILSIVWLLLHFLAMLALAVLLRLHFAWIAIGSMANVGGISTAPAVTAAYNEEWMPYAVILAILSMVSGTTWGLLTVWLFGFLA
ncbi:MAG: DUF819 family protein [Saprospiraceae bacterium]|nr:DUF819 family protein [Saprospiraceae bacterium]